MTEYAPLLQEALKLLVAAGAAFGGVKMSLNGARKDITEIKKKVDLIDARTIFHGERIAVLADRANRGRDGDEPLLPPVRILPGGDDG